VRLSRMDSFWANAWHKVVLPVPGGPERRIRRLVRGWRSAVLRARENFTGEVNMD
jgi:hypothetical protein